MTEQKIRTTEENEGSSYSFKDMIMLVVANWIWFVAAIVLSLGIAVFIIYKTPKVYERSSALLIKDSRRGNMTSALFADITAARIIPNVDNEIYLVRSQRLMTEVVKELKLDVWYSTKGLFRADDLYGISPLEAIFVDGGTRSSSSFVVTKKGEVLQLSNFQVAGRDDIDKRLVVKYNPGDTISTPVGRLVLTPTLYYDRFVDKQAIEVRKTGVDATAIRFMKKLKVELSSEMSTVINLSISDVSSRRAELLLNTLMKVYQNDVIGDKRLVSDVSRTFIDDRLSLIQAELSAEDDRILNFKESNRVVDFQSQTSLTMNEGSRLRTEIFGIENQIALVTYLRDYLADEEDISLVPVNVGITDGNLNELIGDYNKEVLHREELLKSSNERNPTIMSMTSALRAQFEGIMSSISNLLEQLNINLRQAETRERLAMGTISSVPGQENQMQAFVRQQTVKEQLYIYLLNKKEENDLNSVLMDSDSRIVESAYGSSIPIAPKPVQIIVLALLLGCAFPFVVLLVINVLNTTVRSRKDIEGSISVPFFGEIPFMKSSKSTDIVVKPMARDSVSEAFRILRSNIGFMNATGETKVMLVTSTNQGSGKTLFSVNMAATLAQTGKKVVLIDGDLRKRTLTRRYGNVHAEVGLSRYLSGSSSDVDELIAPNIKVPGVDMIFAGVRPPNPAELLLSGRLEELMNELKRRYDFIIIDSVPAFMVADAMVSGRVADRTIYVVREGLMDRRQLVDVEKLYLDKKFPNMMIVLNGVKESTRRYAYGYGYGGYGYGYGEEDESGFNNKFKRLLGRNK